MAIWEKITTVTTPTWTSVSEITTPTASGYISQAQGYSTEIQARLSVLTIEYTWLEKQQAKLQADYDKGLQILMGAFQRAER